MRKQRRSSETIERHRAKSEREAETKFKNAHETLAQKYFLIFPTSIALARSSACDARKSVRRHVARTPNRIFCNKKIFCGKRVCGSSSFAKRRFRLDSIGADSRL